MYIDTLHFIPETNSLLLLCETHLFLVDLKEKGGDTSSSSLSLSFLGSIDIQRPRKSFGSCGDGSLIFLIDSDRLLVQRNGLLYILSYPKLQLIRYIGKTLFRTKIQVYESQIYLLHPSFSLFIYNRNGLLLSQYRLSKRFSKWSDMTWEQTHFLLRQETGTDPSILLYEHKDERIRISSVQFKEKKKKKRHHLI